MTTGLFGTEERRKSARFSRPIWALPDGLLVREGNPQQLTGYRSVADTAGVNLVVIRDQFQHRSAVEFGVNEDQIVVFETYTEAANVVRAGTVDAYDSVGRAHSGFIEQHPELELELVIVPDNEKPPAYGSFAFDLNDATLLNEVNDVLVKFLGSEVHRKMVASFGFSSADVDLVAR